jgi:glycosyltransferase involved in cell wall biosynthesis
MTVGPVLLVTPWYRPVVGGVAEVAERLRRGLDTMGAEAHLFVCDGDANPLRHHPSVPNAWYVYIPFQRLGPRTLAVMLLRAPVALWRICRFVRAHRVRTVILIYPSGYAWPFLLLRYGLNVHLITSCHGSDIVKYEENFPLLRWLLRRVLQSSDVITVCADHLAQKAQELVPSRPLPIRVISNCVDVTHFTPPPPGFRTTDARATLVHVSNFAPTKRTLDILEAFGIAAIPLNSRLVMVGAGPEFAQAVERARTLGIDHRVEFVGMQEDVRPYLWQADLFVLASDSEGDPLALLEAMACGLPWIAPAWGAASVLPRGECGLVVPSRSPRLLAAAMTELINDPQRRRAMGVRARYRAETDFAEAAYFHRHLALIREVESDETSARPVK